MNFTTRIILFYAVVEGVLINNVLFYYRFYNVPNTYISQTEAVVMFWLNLIIALLLLWYLINLILG